MTLNIGHTDWVSWAIEGDVARFYSDLRWPGWEADATALSLAQGISCYPFAWTKEGKDPAAVSRRPVPLRELWGVAKVIHQQLFGVEY